MEFKSRIITLFDGLLIGEPYTGVDHNDNKVEFQVVDGRIFCIPTEEGYGLSLSFWEKIARICYRLTEIVVGFVVLILSLPIMLIVAVVVKLGSPGPVLFFQKRLSKSKLVPGRKLMKDDRYVIVDSKFSPEKEYWVPKTLHLLNSGQCMLTRKRDSRKCTTTITPRRK